MKCGFGCLNWNLPWGRISRRWNPFSDFALDVQNPKSGFQNLNPDFHLHVWTSFILAGKRDCRRHSTVGVSENVVVTETSYEGWSVKSLIILRLGEGQPPSLENSVLGYFTTWNLRRFLTLCLRYSEPSATVFVWRQWRLRVWHTVVTNPPCLIRGCGRHWKTGPVEP